MTTTENPTQVVIARALASGRGPEATLEQLDAHGIEWYVSAEGDLFTKQWTAVARGFMSAADVPNLQQPQNQDADALNWVSAHLEELRAQYPGQWIAVAGGQVRAAAPSLPALLAAVSAQGLQRPFVTQVPAGEINWTMTYAGPIV